MNAPVDVLLVAEPGDFHATAVMSALVETSATTARVNLTDLRATPIRARAGAVEFSVGDRVVTAAPRTTVWWRRLGRFDISDLADEDARLAEDEAPEILRGAFLAAAVRWVDEPFAVARAETKQYQLARARECGLRVPAYVVTSDAAAAREFAVGRELIAKPLSAGVGIAPFTAKVEYGDLAKVVAVPTLLQELVHAAADLRVVVVRDDVWAWRRIREEGVIDWRAVAPDGSGFVPVKVPGLDTMARGITRALGLTMGVHDFLETAEGPVFLETNPQGSWLFLTRANDLVVPSLAAHLQGSRTKETNGEWPSLRRRVLNDFKTKKRAPSADGVVAPTFATPSWITDAAQTPGAIAVARRANDDATESSRVAEEKASRLTQVALALMTVTLALGAFQLQFALDRSSIWLLTLIPIGAAMGCLALSAVEAFQIDRVGYYQTAQVADLVQPGVASDAAVLDAEDQGRKLARWTAKNKLTDLMQARAWFSRGLVALIAAALIGACLRAGAEYTTDRPAPPSNPTTTTLSRAGRP